VALVLVRLKLALLRNGLRTGGTAQVFFWLSIPIAAGLALLGAALFAGLRTLPLEAAAGGTGLFATALLLLWVVSPLYLFASDGTLDPGRLALLPLNRRQLVLGLLAASFVGLPPLATLLALLGSAVGVGRTPAGVAAAVVGAVLATALCVVTSRAVGAALSGVLRSRRGRDLGVVLAALLGGSLGPIYLGVQGLTTSSPEVLLRVGEIARWSPAGLATSAGADASTGRWGLLVADLAVPVLVLGLLLWWWSASVAAALVEPDRSSAASTRLGPSSLRPRWAPWLPVTRGGAVAARELKYQWRDPRKRSAAGIALVVGLFLGVGPAAIAGDGGLGPDAVFAGCWVALFSATNAGNMLGYEGRALWLHLVVPGRSAPDLGGRVAAVVLLGAVPSVLTSTVLAAATGAWSRLPAAVALIAVLLGTGSAVAVLVSVHAPSALPEDPSNPFASTSGGSLRTTLFQLLGMAVQIVLSLPVAGLVLLGLRGWPAALALAPVVGVGYGAVLAVWAVRLAGRVLDERGPELLAAVSPGRST